jgi:hypothetical protein
MSGAEARRRPAEREDAGVKHVSTVLVAAMCLTASTAFARPDGSSAIIYQPRFPCSCALHIRNRVIQPSSSEFDRCDVIPNRMPRRTRPAGGSVETFRQCACEFKLRNAVIHALNR